MKFSFSVRLLAALGAVSLCFAARDQDAANPSGPQTDGPFRKVILERDAEVDGKLADTLKDPMELAVAPDGRVFFAQRDGMVKLIKPGAKESIVLAKLPVFTGLEDGMLGITLDPLTQDSCAFYENNVLIADHGGAVVFEEQAGRDFAQAFGTSRAAIHQNHGHFTVGSTIDEAVFWFVCFERCAQAQLAAMAAGTPKLIPHESAVYTRENAGNAITGWMHFQPLWHEICRTDPDLFD